jgi:chromosome segregation ATPase
MQVHNLQREASERKQWAITKAQCMIFKVEESWKDRLRKEMKSKETVLRERDIARREIEDLKRQLSQLSDKDRQLRTEIDDLKSKLRQSNDKDALVRQLRTENDSCQAEIARLKAELNSLKTQREKLLPDRDRAHLVRCRELLRLLKKSTQNAALSETRVVTTSVSGKNLFDVKFCFRAQYPLHAVPCDYVFELILDSFSSRGCTDN